MIDVRHFPFLPAEEHPVPSDMRLRMLIRLGYDIQFQLPASVAMVALLSVHPSRENVLLKQDELKTEPELKITHYIDSFGNRCSRFVAPPGLLRLSGST